MTDRELMQQVLDALYCDLSVIEDYGDKEQLSRHRKAINALYERLCQPDQEPFEYWNAVEGWVKIDEVRKHFDSVGCGTIYKTAGEDRVPLYTAPTPRRHRQSNGRKDMTDRELMQALEAISTELVEAITDICECPQWVDDATVPAAGIDSGPQQVGLNISAALTRIRKARAVIAKATGEKE